MLDFFFLIDFKVCFLLFINKRYFINVGWIRIRNFCLDPNPELGKFKAKIRTRNKSFRIRNTDLFLQSFLFAEMLFIFTD